MNEINVLRKPITHYNIDRALDLRITLLEKYHSGYPRRFPVTQINRENFHKIADVLIKSNTDYKLVTSYSKIWIYSNVESFITELADLEFVTDVEIKEAIINRPRNTIKLKNPTHTTRSYFKCREMPDKDKVNFVAFFKLHNDHIRCSRGLRYFLDKPRAFYYLSESYFIEYSDGGFITMLMLKYPGLIRKSLNIIQSD
jgi:hypothetical protein